MTEVLDARLHAYRADLADAALEGRVNARSFRVSEARSVSVPVAGLFRTPAGAKDTELLFGETVRVFDEQDDWSWVQADLDRYVGYVETSALSAPFKTTHRVKALSTFVYRDADLKSPVVTRLPHLARFSVAEEAETRGTKYGLIEGLGWVFLGHLEPVGSVDPDYVSVAERYVGVPYLWGGRSAFGLDCSGLIQNAMTAVGLSELRDSDMQEASIGSVLDGGIDALLQRGDLVFWSGHVGVMTDAENLLHANGNTMDVTVEPLHDAVERIERLYARPTSVRRPARLSAQ
ncbi:MAG: NlpC/P60 family protein [Pseudomonadota bacterium]